MKKLLFFAAALLVLVACDNQGNNAPERTPFKKGQQVTLTVGSANQGSQAPARTMSGVRNNDNIAFTWEEGDQILVKVGQESAVFTLSSTPGSAYGEFAGTMPADGSTFDIYYPVEMSDLSEQVYTADEPIPADKMDFAASNCTLGNPVTLTALNAMLQLNLFGTSKTIGKIVFTATNSLGATPMTLTCTEGKAIGTDAANATPFYMVVPAGTYQFEAEIWNNATTPAKICSFATSDAKEFTAGQCLNMPAKEVKEPFVPTYVDLGLPSGVKWATCNVGATKPEEYGDYFAWGETSPKTTYADDWSNCFDTNVGGSNFIKYYNNGGKTTLDHADDAAAANWKGNWRMPTLAEIQELKDKCTWTWTTLNNISGYEVKGSNDNIIFLPASGWRSNSVLYADGDRGYYWSSSLYEYSDSNSAYDLYFSSSDKDYMRSHRCDGLPVRPVCQ